MTDPPIATSAPDSATSVTPLPSIVKPGYAPVRIRITSPGAAASIAAWTVANPVLPDGSTTNTPEARAAAATKPESTTRIAIRGRMNIS